MKSLIITLIVLTLTVFIGGNTFTQPQASIQPIAQAPQAPPQQTVSLEATLNELQGDVQISPEKDAAFAPASNGDTLHVGGQIKTGANGRARLDLSSGTIIRVANSSTFTFQSNEPSNQGGLLTKLKLEIGKLWIILNGGSLDVETKSGVAAVRGSLMSVSVDPETKKIRVTCMEGDCSWPKAHLDLVSGQALTLIYDPVTGQVTLSERGLMTQAELDDWLQNNPEAKDILPSAFATMTALPSETPDQGGTVPKPVAFATGVYDKQRVFALGIAQVTILDEKPGVVKSSRVPAWQFSPALQGNLTYLTDAVQVQTEFPATVQICFAHPQMNMQIKIYQLQGSVWVAVPSTLQNNLFCSSVPAGTYILAGE